MITNGHGMHAVCVMVEETGQLLQPQVNVLVDFLHEVVTHNMFVAGMYCMLGLILKTERDRLGQKLGEKAGHTVNGSIEKYEANDTKFLSCGERHEANTTKSLSGTSSRITLYGVLMHWMWPLILGTYFSIFSTMTGTVTITVLFYIAVYSYTFATYQQLHVASTGGFSRLLGDDLLVFGIIAKASCVGLPVLAFRLTYHSVMSSFCLLFY